MCTQCIGAIVMARLQRAFLYGRLIFCFSMFSYCKGSTSTIQGHAGSWHSLECRNLPTHLNWLVKLINSTKPSICGLSKLPFSDGSMFSAPMTKCTTSAAAAMWIRRTIMRWRTASIARPRSQSSCHLGSCGSGKCWTFTASEIVHASRCRLKRSSEWAISELNIS